MDKASILKEQLNEAVSLIEVQGNELAKFVTLLNDERSKVKDLKDKNAKLKEKNRKLASEMSQTKDLEFLRNQLEISNELQREYRLERDELRERVRSFDIRESDFRATIEDLSDELLRTSNMNKELDQKVRLQEETTSGLERVCALLQSQCKISEADTKPTNREIIASLHRKLKRARSEANEVRKELDVLKSKMHGAAPPSTNLLSIDSASAIIDQNVSDALLAAGETDDAKSNTCRHQEANGALEQDNQASMSLGPYPYMPDCVVAVAAENSDATRKCFGETVPETNTNHPFPDVHEYVDLIISTPSNTILNANASTSRCRNCDAVESLYIDLERQMEDHISKHEVEVGQYRKEIEQLNNILQETENRMTLSNDKYDSITYVLMEAIPQWEQQLTRLDRAIHSYPLLFEHLRNDSNLLLALSDSTTARSQNINSESLEVDLPMLNFNMTERISKLICQGGDENFTNFLAHYVALIGTIQDIEAVVAREKQEHSAKLEEIQQRFLEETKAFAQELDSLKMFKSEQVQLQAQLRQSLVDSESKIELLLDNIRELERSTTKEGNVVVYISNDQLQNEKIEQLTSENEQCMEEIAAFSLEVENVISMCNELTLQKVDLERQLAEAASKIAEVRNREVEKDSIISSLETKLQELEARIPTALIDASIVSADILIDVKPSSRSSTMSTQYDPAMSHNIPIANVSEHLPESITGQLELDMENLRTLNESLKAENESFRDLTEQQQRFIIDLESEVFQLKQVLEVRNAAKFETQVKEDVPNVADEPNEYTQMLEAAVIGLQSALEVTTNTFNRLQEAVESLPLEGLDSSPLVMQYSTNGVHTDNFAAIHYEHDLLLRSRAQDLGSVVTTSVSFVHDRGAPHGNSMTQMPYAIANQDKYDENLATAVRPKNATEVSFNSSNRPFDRMQDSSLVHDERSLSPIKDLADSIADTASRPSFEYVETSNESWIHYRISGGLAKGGDGFVDTAEDWELYESHTTMVELGEEVLPESHPNASGPSTRSNTESSIIVAFVTESIPPLNDHGSSLDRPLVPSRYTASTFPDGPGSESQEEPDSPKVTSSDEREISNAVTHTSSLTSDESYQGDCTAGTSDSDLEPGSDAEQASNAFECEDDTMNSTNSLSNESGSSIPNYGETFKSPTSERIYNNAQMAIINARKLLQQKLLTNASTSDSPEKITSELEESAIDSSAEEETNILWGKTSESDPPFAQTRYFSSPIIFSPGSLYHLESSPDARMYSPVTPHSIMRVEDDIPASLRKIDETKSGNLTHLLESPRNLDSLLGSSRLRLSEFNSDDSYHSAPRSNGDLSRKGVDLGADTP